MKRINVVLLIVSFLFLCGCSIKEPKVEEMEKEWELWQFGNPEGGQLLFWSIESSDGNVVLIDGGYDTDENIIRKYLEKFDSHVSAWIITHPHPDHVGAFNEVMKDPGEITVDAVYTIGVNEDVYRDKARNETDLEAYDNFLEVIQTLDNVHYLKENDELNLLGLKMKVLHTWDEDTEALESDVLNNGAMMFTLTGNEDCMLFCADVESETEQVIIERHSEDLKEVDYLQPGHHGNWGLTTAFYDCINPKAVYFDAPDWLIEPEDDIYDTYKLVDYFEERGIEVISFESAPNKLILR